jgi:chromosome partitioning protein
MLFDQIEDLTSDLVIEISKLGFIVNMYDRRKGYIATSSPDNWKAIGDPPVLGFIPERKEQRPQEGAAQIRCQDALHLRALEFGHTDP